MVFRDQIISMGDTIEDDERDVNNTNRVDDVDNRHVDDLNAVDRDYEETKEGASADGQVNLRF